MDQARQVKGTPVTLCLTHRVPLNRCGCVPFAPINPEQSPQDDDENLMPMGGELRARQERVNAEQWLDMADARERAEWRQKWRDYADDASESSEMPWWVIVAGVACILLALFGLYIVSNGGRL